ncbi:TonB-dependent receptor [Azotobacter beijerinckii]|uniref:Iron complex outermembrane recepter protein n=1 Tax=Azotobacter beijerinckii TaxID=170623 RepID=A0A1I3ZRT8_9GAMM|nr:TonB-dependent receptor [Azotobacter beijerinckii]SFB25966.1 iron complex outermembrane recepter protein [Azotobacter beijerinckii]SFK46667.1 iron complex outermembrane recepter protein [Azotobacter beijerinckii]
MKRHPLAWTFGLSLVPVAWASEPLELESTVVSASALAKKPHEMTTPAEVLEGDALILRREATLGETLDGLPGVRSASFGAGVGRPLIRGQQGARVKMLSDGVDTLDASSVSPDHAVSSEPLLAERIEVLKGPATLLYGGGAIGGVVNTIDKKVPTAVPEKGYEGELELRANSVANEGSGVFGITAGSGNFAVRVEGVKRQADDYEIHGSPSKQEGSYNDTDTFSLGASYIGERGYLGAAYSEQNNRYGLLGHQHAECHLDGPAAWHCGDEHEDEHEGEEHDEHAEEGVPYVDLRQYRWDLRGELADPLPGFERARLRVAHSDYRHEEIEGGQVDTRFDNDASDARLELTHQPLFGWHGVLGGQTLRRDFEATGEEAYVPPTITRNHALFLLEEYTAGAWRYEVGLRHEWQDIEAEGRPDTDHRGTSFSAGAVWSFAPEYSLGFSLSRSQRLPSAEELYADGPHAATRTVELGDPELDEETSQNLELTLRKFAGRTTFSLTLYRNQVDDYIYAADTGRDIGSGYREIEYRQEDALFTGVEGEVRFQASDATAVTLFGDQVRGKLLDGGGDLPRIPAGRLGVRFDHAFASGLDGQLEFYRVDHQHRLADFETKTSGYSMLGASLTHHGTLRHADYQVYLKGDNLLDEKARDHSSFIKDDVVQPGRNLTLGVRMTF